MADKKLRSGTLIAIIITSILLVIVTAGLLTIPQTSPSSTPIATATPQTSPSSTPIATATPQTSPSSTPIATATPQTSPSSTPIATINLGVYSDVGCKIPLTSINWGTLTPGAQVTQTIYLKNTGGITENLSMDANNWSPSNAGTYLTVTWSPTSSTLAAGASTSATLTLTAASGADALSTFNVNIVFAGIQ